MSYDDWKLMSPYDSYGTSEQCEHDCHGCGGVINWHDRFDRDEHGVFKVSCEYYEGRWGDYCEACTERFFNLMDFIAEVGRMALEQGQVAEREGQ
jgi:hypothetical protein